MSGLKQAVRNAAKIIMFKGVYPLCYKVSSLRPLRKNKVIFAEIRSGTPAVDAQRTRRGGVAVGVSDHAPRLAGVQPCAVCAALHADFVPQVA